MQLGRSGNQPKSHRQLAKGMYSNQGAVIFASTHPIICEICFNFFRPKPGWVKRWNGHLNLGSAIW